jgi:hypothetical protein
MVVLAGPEGRHAVSQAQMLVCKDEAHVAKLVAGPRLLIPRVYICDKCPREAIRIMDSAPAPQR